MMYGVTLQHSNKYVFFFYNFRGGTFGFLSECGAEKKVSKYSSVSATVCVGVPSGVTLKIKYVPFINLWHYSTEHIKNVCVFFIFPL